MTATLAASVDRDFLSKIGNRSGRIGLIGLGYVGVPLDAAF